MRLGWNGFAMMTARKYEHLHLAALRVSVVTGRVRWAVLLVVGKGWGILAAITLFRIERIKMTASLGLYPRAGDRQVSHITECENHAADSERDSWRDSTNTQQHWMGW